MVGEQIHAYNASTLRRKCEGPNIQAARQGCSCLSVDVVMLYIIVISHLRVIIESEFFLIKSPHYLEGERLRDCFLRREPDLERDLRLLDLRLKYFLDSTVQVLTNLIFSMNLLAPLLFVY